MDKAAQELNDNLLKCDFFKCKHCCLVLRSPIVYVEGKGNYCWSCANNFAKKRRNYDMENVLSKLSVPCRFENNGCRVQRKANIIGQHESVCGFHNLVCPYTCLNECNEESIVNIVEHFEESHTHSIITTESDTVKLCFHVNTLYNQLNLLVINGEKFLLHIVRDIGEMHYFVYYMGDVELIDVFSCTIEHIADTMRIEAKAAILRESNYPNLDRTKATTFNLRFLREIFKDNINVTIKITSKRDVPTPPCSDNNNEKFLTCFECPVCSSYMRPPIFQCFSGHSICNKCRARVGHCPTCRSGYGGTRNFILESLSTGIKYPCLFRELGCELQFSVNEISGHEDECPLRPINCPFSEYLHCGWAGPSNNIVGHLKSAHPQETISDNICTETIDYTNDVQFYHMRALLAYGKVFRICHQRHIGDQNGYWSVQVVGAKGEAHKYTCHVALTDLNNPSRSLVRTDVCQDFSTLDIVFHHCIVIPLSVVSWFSSGGKLQLNYKVVN